MEIAISGLLIFLLLLPGYLFRVGYFSGEFSKQYVLKSFFELCINTLMPSLLFYVVFYYAIGFLNYTYDFKVIYGLLSSNDDLIDYSISNVEDNFTEIVIFLVSINLISFFVGLLGNFVIMKFSFDAINPFLTYSNVWHYIFSGKIFLLKRNFTKFPLVQIEEIDVVFVDVLVEVCGRKYIYNGLLENYILSSDGSLDLVFISFAKKKLVKPIPTNIYENSYSDCVHSVKNDFENVSGSIIVLKYSNIININLQYIDLEVLENNDVRIKNILNA